MEGPEISLAPDIIGTISGFPVTNTLVVSFGASVTLSALALLFFARRSAVPGRFQAACELLFEKLLALMDAITHERKRTERYAPIVFTIFLFVLTANLVEILPGVESLTMEIGEQSPPAAHGERTVHHVPLLRSPSSDLNMTLALAVIAVISAHVFGIAAHGFFRHANTYITFKNPIHFFVGILELVGEFAKVLSFSFRLFGNIFAGGVLLVVVSAIVPLLAPLPFLGLELFVGLIQALVFSVLSLVFITMATETHH